MRGNAIKLVAANAKANPVAAATIPETAIVPLNTIIGDL